jgi:hypothetical protein
VFLRAWSRTISQQANSMHELIWTSHISGAVMALRQSREGMAIACFLDLKSQIVIDSDLKLLGGS